MKPARSLLLLLALAPACGDDEALPDAGAVSVDAPAPDAPPDAPPPDAAVDASIDGAPVALAALDPAFGTDGWVAFAGSISAIAVQADHRLVACGGTIGGPAVVVRLLASGAPDPSFGSGGSVLLPEHWTCFSIAVLADGRIVVGVTPSAHFRVLSPAGVPLATPGYLGAEWATSITPMADGGFAFAGVDPRAVGLQMVFDVTVGRYTAALAPVTAFAGDGSASVSTAELGFPRARLARVQVGAVERLVVGTGGRTTGVAADTGVLDGSYGSTPADALGPIAVAARAGVVVTGYRRRPPAPPGPLNSSVQTLAANGAAGGAAILDYCDAYDPDETTAAVAFDAAGRVVVVPVGGGEWPEVRLTRLSAAGGGLDPAWGCGRAFTLPAYCPAGATCPGDPNSDSWITAVDAVVTDGDAIVVIGNQRRDVPVDADPTRGFIARVLP